MKTAVSVTFAALALLIAFGGDARAQSKCSGGEIKAASKKAGGKVKCWSKATSKGLAVDSTCLGNAEGKFSTAYGKAVGKADCNTTVAAGTIETKVDNFVQDVVSEVTAGGGTTTTTIGGGTTTTTTMVACNCCTANTHIKVTTTPFDPATVTGPVHARTCAISAASC